MSLFGIGGGSSKSSTSPWAAQQPFLKDVWADAQQLWNRGAYAGDYAADIQPWQTGGAQSGADLFGLGQQTAGTFGQYGGELAGGLNQASDYYGNILDRGTGYQNPYAGGVNMGLVEQVANSPYLNDQIGAALRDPYRQLTEDTLPGNAVNAIASGNSGSSRRQMGDAIARRGYEDRAADVGAQMRGAAYDRGLGFASEFAGYEDQGQQINLAGQQRAAQGLDSLGRAGLGYLSDEYDFGQSSAQNLAGWGDYLQQLNQGQIGGEMDKWNAPMDLLNAYAGIVQAGNWGGTTKNKGTNWGVQFGSGGGSGGGGGGSAGMFSMFGG